MNITLIRVDLEKHMDRRYSVAVQPTLLDPLAVVCIWGSRRGGYQRLQVHPAATPEEARKLAEKIVRTKLRRGYVPE
jgi:predicted DNA-binding WGR domain protein